MAQLTSRQITEWQAYEDLEPIGEWRADYRTALLCSIVMNLAQSIYAKKGTHPKLTTPKDFMIDWAGDFKKEEMPQTLEEMKSVMISIAGMGKRGKK